MTARAALRATRMAISPAPRRWGHGSWSLEAGQHEAPAEGRHAPKDRHPRRGSLRTVCLRRMWALPGPTTLRFVIPPREGGYGPLPGHLLLTGQGRKWTRNPQKECAHVPTRSVRSWPLRSSVPPGRCLRVAGPTGTPSASAAPTAGSEPGRPAGSASPPATDVPDPEREHGTPGRDRRRRSLGAYR